MGKGRSRTATITRTASAVVGGAPQPRWRRLGGSGPHRQRGGDPGSSCPSEPTLIAEQRLERGPLLTVAAGVDPQPLQHLLDWGPQPEAYEVAARLVKLHPFMGKEPLVRCGGRRCRAVPHRSSCRGEVGGGAQSGVDLGGGVLFVAGDEALVDVEEDAEAAVA